MTHIRSETIAFILDNSLLLLAGTAAAVVWANLDFLSYDAVAHPLHFWVNEIGMVFFFALAAKEVFEATLPGGSLASARRAFAPLAAAIGGMVAPALIYVALASLRGPTDLVRGWAIPCATDIAFSAMIARLIFPSTHPAIPFLLLLAIADDALGLVILAVFYPSGTLTLAAALILMPAAIGLALCPTFGSTAAWLIGCTRAASFWLAMPRTSTVRLEARASRLEYKTLRISRGNWDVCARELRGHFSRHPTKSGYRMRKKCCVKPIERPPSCSRRMLDFACCETRSSFPSSAIRRCSVECLASCHSFTCTIGGARFRARSDPGGVGGESALAIGRQTSCSQMCGPDIGRRCSA